MHQVGRDRREMAHRSRRAIVDDEIGERQRLRWCWRRARARARRAACQFRRSRRCRAWLPQPNTESTRPPRRSVVRVVGVRGVAEGLAEALGRQHVALGRRDVDAGVAHVVQPGRMRGDQVVVVDRVLDQELPVRLDVVFLRAGDDLHAAGRRLIDDEVDVILGASEIRVQVDCVRIEIGEIEILVVLEPRHRRQGLALLGSLGLASSPGMPLTEPSVL